MFNLPRRAKSITEWCVCLIVTCALLQHAAKAAPSIILSKHAGPPTSQILVSGSGFAPNAGVDLFFDTSEEALVVTNDSGGFDDAKIQAPRSARPGQHWVTALERNNDKGAQEPFLVRTDWAQFRFDASHSGVNPYENVLDSKTVGGLTVAWKYPTGSSSSPSLWDGVLYIVTEDGILALDADSGHRLWQMGDIVGGTGVSVANGNVYAGSDGEYFYAQSATTGSVSWQYATGVDQGSPTIADGVLYVGSVPVGDTLYALDPISGARQWSNQTNVAGSDSSPAVADGVLFIGSLGGEVYSFDARSGSLLWKYATSGSVESAPAVANGMVFFGSSDNNIYALNATTGTLLWKHATASGVNASPAVDNGIVYIGSGDNTLYALEAGNGNFVWKYTTGGPIFSSAAVANGVVYVGSSDANVYAFDATTGSLLWKYATGYWVPSSPAVANGMLYVGSDDGNIYAFGLSEDGIKEDGIKK